MTTEAQRKRLIKKHSYNLYVDLCNLLEWAKGLRGTKSGNPYMFKEVKDALKTISIIQGHDDYLDADTHLEATNVQNPG